MYEWRTGRSCLYKNIVHLIFVTKYRRNVLTLEMLNRLEDIYIETAQQMDCELLEFGGEDESTRPSYCSRLVRGREGDRPHVEVGRLQNRTERNPAAYPQ